MAWGSVVAVAGAVAVLVVLATMMTVRRRYRRPQTRTEVSYDCRLRGRGHPYPEAFVHGRLVVGPGLLEFRTHSARTSLDLTRSGLRPRAERPRLRSEHLQLGKDDVVLICVDGHGTLVDVVLVPADLEKVRDTLQDRPEGQGLPRHCDPQDPLSRGLPRVLVMAGLLLGGASGVLVLTGDRVPATVVAAANGHGHCTVVWRDPADGSRRHNGVDCDQDAGATVEVIALAGPLHGQVVDTRTPWFWAAFSGLVTLLGPLVVGLRAWRRWRRARADRSGWGPLARDAAGSGRP